MRVFCLQPSDAGQWLSPAEAAERLTGLFDELRADATAGREFGENFVNKYRQLLALGLGDETSTPLEQVEREWRDAILVVGADKSRDTAAFFVYVKTESFLEPRFGNEASYDQRRATAKKIASALNYTVEQYDFDD